MYVFELIYLCSPQNIIWCIFNLSLLVLELTVHVVLGSMAHLCPSPLLPRSLCTALCPSPPTLAV